MFFMLKILIVCWNLQPLSYTVYSCVEVHTVLQLPFVSDICHFVFSHYISHVNEMYTYENNLCFSFHHINHNNVHLRYSTLCSLFMCKNCAPVPLFVVKYSSSCHVYNVMPWCEPTERWCCLVEEVASAILHLPLELGFQPTDPRIC